MRVCPRCHGRYEGEPRFCPRDGAPLRGDTDPRIGQVLLGQFELLEICGKGAMGTVYRAWQTGMERQIAVKILRSELLREPAVVKRFHREARAVARLAHPNIVTVFLVGETDDGTPYLAMEYVEGEPLAEIASREGAMPPARALRIGRQIASALADAHAEGIVHRDLKPANILVSQRRRAEDFVKVLDFGIAKILHGAAIEEGALSHLTRTGTIFGTPHYISPEQASGGDVDHRADLYSLGVILYRLLTGRLPYEGAGIAVLLAHVNQPLPRPQEVRPELDLRLDAFLVRALAKDPSDRFQSAEVMSDAIDELIATEASGAVAWSSWTGAFSGAPQKLGARTVQGVGAPGSALRARETVVSSDGGSEPLPDSRPVAGVRDGTRDGAPREGTPRDAGVSNAPLFLDDGPSSWSYTPPRRRGALLAAIAGVIAAGLAVAGGYLLGRGQRGSAAVATDAPAPPPVTPAPLDAGVAREPPTPTPSTPPPTPRPPRSAAGLTEGAAGNLHLLTLGEGGYAVRAFVPTRPVVDREYDLTFEIRDPSGKTLAAASISASFEEPDGVSRTVVVKSVGQGKYSIRRKFAAEGHYHVHVYPVASKPKLRVWFDLHVESEERRRPAPPPIPVDTKRAPSPSPTPVSAPIPSPEPVPEPAEPDPQEPEPAPTPDPEPPLVPPPDRPAGPPDFADPPPPSPDPDPYRIIDDTPPSSPPPSPPPSIDAGFLE